MTRELVDKIRSDVPGSKVLLYFDSNHVPIKSGCSTGHVMGDRPGRNCSTTYRCGDGNWTDAIRAAFKPNYALRSLNASGVPDEEVVCLYPGLANFVPYQDSVDAVTGLLEEWAAKLGFDGVYLDNRLTSSTFAKSISSGLAGLGDVDANGDGKPDTIDEIIQQYATWANVLSHKLRTALGPSSTILGNSGGAISDPSLSGITVEMEACKDTDRCIDVLVGQRQASSDYGDNVVSVLWLTHAESVPPEVQCARAAAIQKALGPWVLKGTDFFDGSHVVCD